MQYIVTVQQRIILADEKKVLDKLLATSLTSSGRTIKKQGIINKLIMFFEKYFGLF